jgi:hypothetical protein
MPGGGYRPGAGRPKSPVKAALDQARGDPLRQVRLAGQFAGDKTLPASERLRAIAFTLRMARLDRVEPRPRQRVSFRVVSATADEMAAHLAERRRAGTTPAQ